MTPTESQIVKQNIQSQINGDYVAPILIEGPPGTGKTSSLKKIAKDGNLHLVNYSATTLTIEALTG